MKLSNFQMSITPIYIKQDSKLEIGNLGKVHEDKDLATINIGEIEYGVRQLLE